LDIPAFLRKQA
nr:Chain K, C-terminal Tail of FtsZ [synthetic construct]